MKNLKRRWNITSNLQLVLILIVFAVNGSFAAWVAKPVTDFFDLSPESMGPWMYYLIRILLVFPIYQLTLPVVGFMFGQFKFFWEFEKKFLSRIGLGFLFQK
tara:strand:- start:227 stop:532 length:306 start_codon:yes stop_codon:yes gene_type:complete